ncbi:MAG: AAA family ATPase, partial [Actinomycetota bacterium]
METIVCPKCGEHNADTQRFCSACGSRLELVCPRCGETNAPNFKFCGTCGAPLEPGARAAGLEERRWATVLFADLSGFTPLSEQMDPEEVRTVADRSATKLGEIVGRYGGWVNRVLGDAVLAVFGAPVAHEDDAERAVRAALEMQQYARENPADFENLTIRIGITTGESMFAPVGPEGAREPTVMGDVVNTASRLQSEAPPGGTLVGEETYRATQKAITYSDVLSIQAKGKAEPVRAWLALEPIGAPAERPISAAPMVGRDAELEILRQTWSRVLNERRPHLVTVFGPAGIGKSRLARELIAAIAPSRVVRGRCLPYGGTIGYGAFAQQIKKLAGVFDSDPAPAASKKIDEFVGRLFPAEQDVAAQVRLILGLETEAVADPQVLLFTARRLVEAIAHEEPTVFFFEDVHWADQSLLSLLESLASRTRDAPALFLTLARPELLDDRPNWGGGLASYTALRLDPLSAADAQSLALHLLGAKEAPSLAQQLSDRGEGNPLFLEELAASLAEHAESTIGELPTNLKGIIAARLDSLPAHARALLLDASVVGKIFWRGALLRMGTDGRLDESLDVLETRDFIRREPTSSIQRDVEFSFKHILIREVAYATLPKAARRERHAAVAEYVEEAAADRIGESGSLLAHHWEEAGDNARAVEYLLMAADRARLGWAKQEAVSFLDQALNLIPPDDGDRRQVLELRKSMVLSDAGDHPAAAAALDRLIPQLNGRELMEATHARGKAAFWIGDVEGVRVNARKLAVLAEQPGGEEFRALALALEQSIRGMDGILEAGTKLGKQAIEVWPDDLYPAERAFVFNQLSLHNVFIGEFAEAETYGRRSYELAVDIQSVEGAFLGGTQRTMALTGLGRHEEALAFIETLVAQWRHLEAQPRQTARALNIWAGTLRDIFSIEKSKELNAEAFELGERAAFQNAKSQASVDLLFADLALGDFGSVVNALPAAEEEAAKLKGWHEWLVDTRLGAIRARVALETGPPEGAAEIASEAIKKATHYGRLKYEIEGRLALGSALLQLGRPEDSSQELRLALDAAERMAHPGTLWRASAALGNHGLKTG